MPLEGFLKVDGIDGESKDARHRDWIDVHALSWGVTQEALPAPDGGLRPGTPEVRSVSFTHAYDRASVGLFQACAMGRQVAQIRFEAVVRAGDEPFVFLRAAFKDCLVTKVQASSGGDTINETVEFVFRGITLEAEERPR
jgi:type VI secretion system secreted protein Hcp